MLAATVLFTIVVNPELIPDGDIGPLLEALSDLEPCLVEMGQVMADAQKENFATAGGLFGEWEPLSDRTEWDKHRRGFPPQPLVREGRLQDAIGQTVLLSADSVTTGLDLTDVPYAEYHQTGTSRMPARILVALTEAEVADLLETLRAFIADKTGGELAGVEISAQ